MFKQVFATGLLGGIVMFIWGFISHMVLPLGEAGIKTVPNEEFVLAAMRESINSREASVYLFPGYDRNASMTPEQMRAFYERWEQGPTGFLVYHPGGMPAFSPMQLAGELIANFLSALIAAYLLLQAVGRLKSFGGRALFVFVLGLVPFFTVDASYFIWYGFPLDFTLAGLMDQAVGFGLAGLVMAWKLNRAGV